MASALPLDQAKTVLEGTDVTLLGYGPMVRTCAGVRRSPPAEDGRSIEVIDLRSLSPLDDGDDLRLGAPDRPLRGRARGAGVRAGSAPRSPPGSPSECFYHLEAPVLRVGGFATPYPPSRLEDHYLPDLDRILDAVDRTFGY